MRTYESSGLATATCGMLVSRKLTSPTAWEIRPMTLRNVIPSSTTAAMMEFRTQKTWRSEAAAKILSVGSSYHDAPSQISGMRQTLDCFLSECSSSFWCARDMERTTGRKRNYRNIWARNLTYAKLIKSVLSFNLYPLALITWWNKIYIIRRIGNRARGKQRRWIHMQRVARIWGSSRISGFSRHRTKKAYQERRFS